MTVSSCNSLVINSIRFDLGASSTDFIWRQRKFPVLSPRHYEAEMVTIFFIEMTFVFRQGGEWLQTDRNTISTTALLVVTAECDDDTSGRSGLDSVTVPFETCRT